MTAVHMRYPSGKVICHIELDRDDLAAAGLKFGAESLASLLDGRPAIEKITALYNIARRVEEAQRGVAE